MRAPISPNPAAICSQMPREPPVPRATLPVRSRRFFTPMRVSPSVATRSEHFEESSGTHAAADAHRDDDVADTAALPFDERVPDQAGAGHTVRVTNGNRATIDVVLIRVDSEPVAAVQRLARERFVELPEADVADREPMLREKSRHRVDRSDAHFLR